MVPIIFALYALAHTVLFAWALQLLVRHREVSAVPLALVTFGLVYDNLILATGAWIGHGEMLERLSVPRFFMHAFGTPLLMLSALGMLRRIGPDWTRTKLAASLVGSVTVAMVAVGVDADLIRLDLAAKEVSGLVSYGNAATEGPPIAPIVTILVLLAAGFLAWRHDGGPWMLLGAVAQFIAAFIGDRLVIAGNLGEVALLAGLVVTQARISRRRDADPRARPPAI